MREFITSQFQLFALIFPFAKVINIPVILNDKLVSFSFLLKKKKRSIPLLLSKFFGIFFTLEPDIFSSPEGFEEDCVEIDQQIP